MVAFVFFSHAFFTRPPKFLFLSYPFIYFSEFLVGHLLEQMADLLPNYLMTYSIIRRYRWPVCLQMWGLVMLLSWYHRYPVILSIENHCSVVQQKKMAQYLTNILGDKLDLSSVSSEDTTMLPSPQMLKGKILVKVILLGPPL